jgi:hypothetical protein
VTGVDIVLRCTPSELAKLKPILADMRRKPAYTSSRSEVGQDGPDRGRIVDILKLEHQEISIPRGRLAGSVPPTPGQLLDRISEIIDRAHASTGSSSRLSGFYESVYASHASHALAMGVLSGIDLSRALREDGNPYVEVCMDQRWRPVFHLHEMVDDQEITTRIACDQAILEDMVGAMPMCCYITYAQTSTERSAYAKTRTNIASVIDEEDGIVMPVPDLDAVAMLRLAAAVEAGAVKGRGAA